ncbi:MAG: efflux RND transporter periplasmic adaptor subunit, partial [Rhodoferax sp.]|nr:efflux RND transporter periplasmic adaptor subunit [Rhodoferax sp.]
MKQWIKWAVAVAVVAALLGITVRVLAAREAKKALLESQQAAALAQALVLLTATDLVQAQLLELPQTLSISGPLKAARSAFVKVRVPGELQGLQLREGDPVKAGDIVARIESTEYQARLRQAQQQAESARAQVDIAKRNFANNRSLVEQGFISKTALDASLATLNAAEANFQAAQAGVDLTTKSLEDTVLRAPLSGHIAQRLAQPGERVSVDTRVLEIVDLSQLELEASLSAADSVRVRVGQSAELSIEGASQSIAAKVVRVSPSAVAGSRAVLAYLALAGQAGLRQGLFAQGGLSTGTVRAIAVPLSSVRTDKPQPYVQQVQGDQVLHTTVSVGDRADLAGQTLVAVQGLTEGA